MQAEIERFAEEVAEHDEAANRSDDEGASGDDDAAPKKGNSKRTKKALNGTAAVPAGTSIHQHSFLNVFSDYVAT